jgi:predicted peptidase
MASRLSTRSQGLGHHLGLRPLDAALAIVVAWNAGSALAHPDSAGAASAGVSGRFVERIVRVSGTPRPYRVWLPPAHGAHQPWPAILFLHGSGECGVDGLKPTRIGLGPALDLQPERWPFVVVFPQKPREDEEWEENEALVLAVMDAAKREFHIDADRVALAGVSQGGHGVWLIGARHAGRWSCLVPVCGYGRARTVSGRVARLPVWAFHGLRDDLVDPEDTRRIVEGIAAERRRLDLDTTKVRVTWYPEANHNSWDSAFAEPGLPGWILEQRRMGTRKSR